MTRGERLGVVLFSLFLLGLVAAELLSEFTPRKLSVLFIVAFWGPLLVVHELGHALAARWLGWRLHEIAEHLGTSQRTLRRRLERLEARCRALLHVEMEVSHAG